MPRSARLWEPGQVLHVIARGHEGRALFANDEDREFFTARMAAVFARTGTACLAWALPVNHYHVLVRVGGTPPGEVFRCVNTPVAQRERRRRGDHGSVFQDRYFSRPCDGDGLIAALTYVLGNPVHHHSVPTAEALETYRWTAYPELLGLASPGLVDVAQTLSFLNADTAVAQEMLRRAMRYRVARWLSGGHDDEPDEEWKPESPDARIVRSRPPGLVSAVHDERLDRRARLRAAGWAPRDLVVAVCARLGASPERLAEGGRGRAEAGARAVIAFVACDAIGETSLSVAGLTGVTDSAIIAARRRGRALLARSGWTPDDVLSWTPPPR